MKHLFRTISTLTLVLILSTANAQSWFNKEKTIGNGDITTQTINTSDYDAIHVVGFLDVEIVNGREGEISVTTDSNLHEYIDVEVKDNILVIKIKEKTKISTKKGVWVTVPVESISKVHIAGSGNLSSDITLKANEFKLNVSGSGNATMVIDASKIESRIAGSGDIELSGSYTELELSIMGSGSFTGSGQSAKSIEVTIVGSGDVTLSGDTSKLDLRISGSGDFHGFKLNADQTKVSVTGSGDAQVVARQNIVARTSGSGNIVYKGNPTHTDLTSNGAGKIRGIR
jgi:hypothetical protein